MDKHYWKNTGKLVSMEMDIYRTYGKMALLVMEHQ